MAKLDVFAFFELFGREEEDFDEDDDSEEITSLKMLSNSGSEVSSSCALNKEGGQLDCTFSTNLVFVEGV